MMTNTKEKLAYYVTFLLAGGYLAWWLVNAFAGHPGDRAHELYGDTYWVTALLGAIIGLFAAKQWGGFKSIFGKALSFLSLGLLAQVFGQVTYSYFALVKNIQAPYPSIGDIGFFGSIILYVAGIIFLSRAVGARFRYASIGQSVIAVIVPLAILASAYVIFLKGYQSTGHPLVTFLDYGYPLGEALYIGLALLTYVLSFKLLGGRMKNKILLLLFALAVQYSADFVFLYQFAHDTWYVGGFNDLQYQIAYFLMTISLLSIGGVALSIKAGSEAQS